MLGCTCQNFLHLVTENCAKKDRANHHKRHKNILKYHERKIKGMCFNCGS